MHIAVPILPRPFKKCSCGNKPPHTTAVAVGKNAEVIRKQRNTSAQIAVKWLVCAQL